MREALTRFSVRREETLGDILQPISPRPESPPPPTNRASVVGVGVRAAAREVHRKAVLCRPHNPSQHQSA